MKFSLHYSILLVAATVACVAAAPTTTGPDAIVQKQISVAVAHLHEVASNKFNLDKAVNAQKKTVAEKDLEAAKALADKLGGEAATARESATGFKETAEQTRQTVVTSLGDAVNAYTRAKESYEKISGTPDLDKEVLQNLKNAYENARSAIGANNIGRNEALFAALEADAKEKAADVAKTTVDDYALSIGQLTEEDNMISQRRQAVFDRLSACGNDLDCPMTKIIGDNIEEPVDEINTAEDETAKDETAEDETAEKGIDPTLTGSDPNQVKEDKVEEGQVKEDKVEEGQVDKDKTGTADGKAKTADDNDAEDMVDDLDANKKAAKKIDSKMNVGKEEESEMEVGAATTITEQETPEDKAAEKKRLEEIAAEKENKEKRVKDAAREAAEKTAGEVAKEEKASEKVNKIKKDKAARKDEEAEVVAEEGEATKKGEMKGEDKTVKEEKAGENDETKGVDKTVQEEKAGETVQKEKAGETVQKEKASETVRKEKAGETVQEEKAGESGEKKGEDKTKNAVVQDSGAKFNQPAVAVGILSVMFALAFGV